MYGGLEIIMSNFCLRKCFEKGLKRSPCSNFTDFATPCICAFSLATLIAPSLISEQVTLTLLAILASETPIAPLPVQRSKISHSLRFTSMSSPRRVPVFIISSASSTSVSVSCLGMSTFSFTMNSRPMNSWLPMMY